MRDRAQDAAAGRRERHVLQYGGRKLLVAEGAPVVVGRRGEVDLVLDHTTVSRRHARFFVIGPTLFVEDLESRNGVRVNGVRIVGAAVLAPGDCVGIGDQELTVGVSAETERPTRPPVAPSRAEQEETSDGGTQPILISARMYLDRAALALDDGRFVEALRGFRDVVLAVENEVAHGTVDAKVVVQGTIALLQLTDATGETAPIELLLRLRRVAAMPLDPSTTEEVARSVRELPRGADEERRAYCRWLRSRPASFTERLALQRLHEA